MNDTIREFTDRVRSYWEETTNLYLQQGNTFQGGFIKEPGKPINSYTNNLYLASRAGIQPNYRVLDAGCGVCGPSIDIARNIPNIHIDAVTLSKSQAAYASSAITEAGCSDKIQVHVGDYHDLPFESNSFDVVFFFESMYSLDLPRLLTEVMRLLVPGGRLYAKEVFRLEHSLSVEEKVALDEFENLFCYKTRRMSEMVQTIAEVGFCQIESEDLSLLASTLHYSKAMVEYVYGFPLPSEFGKRHARNFNSAPLLFGEVKACKPQ